MSDFKDLELKKQNDTFASISKEFEDKPKVLKPMRDMEDIKKNKLHQDNEDILKEQLNKTILVMPEAYKEHEEEEKEEEGAVGIERFPESLRSAINALVGWRKLKAVSSGPVKEAAEKLMTATDDAVASERLGKLLEVSIKYLDKRNDQWHIWFGDGRRRLKQVKKFIDEAYIFSAKAPAVYNEKINYCMDSFYMESMEKPEKYHRFVENAALLRDMNTEKEEGDEKHEHLSVEKDLSKKKFDKLLGLFSDFNEMGYEQLHFESTAHKANNLKVLRGLKNKGREILRGLAMDMEVKLGEGELQNVLINISAINYMLEHIDEPMVVENILNDRQKEVLKEKKTDKDELDRYYGIANGYCVAKDEKDFREYITKLQGNLDEQEIKARRHQYMNTGNPLAWQTSLTIPKKEKYSRYINLLRRKAIGTLANEASGVGVRYMSSLKQKMDDIVEKKNYAAAGQIISELLKTDLNSLRKDMIKQYSMSTARLYELMALRDYMPFITANAKAIGISPDELSRIDAYCAVSGQINETVRAYGDLYAKGIVYTDPEEIGDSIAVKSLREYGRHISNSTDPEVLPLAKKLTAFSDIYNDVTLGYMKKSTDTLLSEAIMKKENSVMADGMKEVETLLRFNGDETSFTEEQYEAKNKRRTDHINYMIELCSAYLAHEKNTASDRYKKIQLRINKLRSALSGVKPYKEGIIEIFKAEDSAVAMEVAGISARVFIPGNTKVEHRVMDEKLFGTHKKQAVDILKELVQKCDAQEDILKNGIGNDELIGAIEEIRQKRKAQIEKLEKLTFPEYKRISTVRLFDNFLELGEYDEADVLSEQQSFKKLAGQYNEKTAKEKPIRPDKNEAEERIDQYWEKRNSNLKQKVSDFEGKISAFLKEHDEYDSAEDIILAVSEEKTSVNAIMTKFFDNRFSDMNLDDVMTTGLTEVFCPLTVSLNLRVGAEDISAWQGYILKLLEDKDFAKSMGVLPQHKEQMDEFRAMVSELLVLSARKTMKSYIMNSALQIDTAGLSENKKKLAEAISNYYNKAFRDADRSMMTVMEEKYTEFSNKFAEFIVNNDIKTAVANRSGKDVDKMSVVESYENLAVTEGMSEEEACRAKLNILKDALRYKFPETKDMSEQNKKLVEDVSGIKFGDNLVTHLMLLKVNYYENLLSGDNIDEKLSAVKRSRQFARDERQRIEEERRRKEEQKASRLADGKKIDENFKRIHSSGVKNGLVEFCEDAGKKYYETKGKGIKNQKPLNKAVLLPAMFTTEAMSNEDLSFKSHARKEMANDFYYDFMTGFGKNASTEKRKKAILRMEELFTMILMIDTKQFTINGLRDFQNMDDHSYRKLYQTMWAMQSFEQVIDIYKDQEKYGVKLTLTDEDLREVKAKGLAIKAMQKFFIVAESMFVDKDYTLRGKMLIEDPIDFMDLSIDEVKDLSAKAKEELKTLHEGEAAYEKKKMEITLYDNTIAYKEAVAKGEAYGMGTDMADFVESCRKKEGLTSKNNTEKILEKLEEKLRPMVGWSIKEGQAYRNKEAEREKKVRESNKKYNEAMDYHNAQREEMKSQKTKTEILNRYEEGRKIALENIKAGKSVSEKKKPREGDPRVLTEKFTVYVSDENFVTEDNEKYVSRKDKKLFDGDIDLTTFKQGAINECYLMATLGSLIVNNQDFIKKTLINEIPGDDEHCIVNLYDPDGQPVAVKVDKTCRAGDDRPLWFIIFEKAACIMIPFHDVFEYRKMGMAVPVKVKKETWEEEFSKRTYDPMSLGNGSEDMAAALIFGKQALKLNNRERVARFSDDVVAKYKAKKKADGSNEGADEAYDDRFDKNANVPEADTNIGMMVEYAEAGKTVIASSCTLWNFGDVSKEEAINKFNYNPREDAIYMPSEDYGLVRNKHVYQIMGKGKKDRDGFPGIKVRDPYGVGRDHGISEIPFLAFKRYFTDIRVVD